MYNVEGIDIRYLGFHPSEWVQTYLGAALSNLRDHLPPGARMRAVIKRQNKTLVANIDILSRRGRFFVPVTAPRVSQLCHRIEERVHRQVDKWRDKLRRRNLA